MRHLEVCTRQVLRTANLLVCMIGCGLVASGDLLAQSPFVVLASGSQPEVATTVRLNQDIEVRIEGGALLATVRGEQVPVPSTEPGGCGTFHALTLEPSGRVVLAAESGLFVLDAEHLIADRMDVEEDLPEGAPLGVAADGQNRIWLCTSSDFAVVDARFGYTRTFAREDLPPGPFVAVHAVDGRVLLQTQQGWFSYRPDQGQPPSTVDGNVVEDSLQADPAGRIKIALKVRGNGGATLRHRRRHHHRLYPVRDDIVDGLRPGKHVVEVLGIDRDLRTGLVARYQVHAPLPPQYSVVWLPVMAAAGCGVLLLLAWPRSGRRRKTRALLRTGVAAVLGVQLLAATLGYGRSWPFVGFSMYTENYYAGSVLYKPRLRGIFEDGRLERVGFWAAGIVQDDAWQMLSELAHGSGERLQKRLDIMNRRRQQRGQRGPKFVGIEIADMRTRLTADGPFLVAPTIVRRWSQP